MFQKEYGTFQTQRFPRFFQKYLSLISKCLEFLSGKFSTFKTQKCPCFFSEFFGRIVLLLFFLYPQRPYYAVVHIYLKLVLFFLPRDSCTMNSLSCLCRHFVVCLHTWRIFHPCTMTTTPLPSHVKVSASQFPLSGSFCKMIDRSREALTVLLGGLLVSLLAVRLVLGSYELGRRWGEAEG